MSRQNHLLHYHISKKRQISWLDKTAVIAAFIYPLSGLPQVIEVFQGNVDGVSVSSWLGFIAFSTFFMIYGAVHKIKPMIITNALWLVIDGLVVAGVLVHKMIV
jgi:uncharacterized protein with PQ loop repeat